jgi:hypothetical protein
MPRCTGSRRDDRVHAEAAVARLPLAGVLVVADPRTISHESPPSGLRKSDAGSTPHHRSFLPGPGSIDQMFSSARPSSFGNAGADFVSLKDLPRSVERRTFMPKNGLQLDAYRRGGAARVDQRRVHRHAGAERAAQRELLARLRAFRDEQPFFVPTARTALGHDRPPETAGRIVRTSPDASGVSRPSRRGRSTC